jgi:hypothetical protein
MHFRYTEHTRTLLESVLDSPGETTAELRHAVEARSALLGGRASQEAEPIPASLERYVKKVALYAYRIMDEDVEALRADGYSENAIFELTVSAALGAGMARLERGLAVLKGAVDATQDH